MTCRCSLCKRNDRIERALKGQPRRIKKLVNDLNLTLMCEETDAAHYMAILKGTWPGAVGYLQDALKKAIKIQEKHPEWATA